MSKCGHIKAASNVIELILIDPESDHCLALSLTHSLTYSCFVDLVDMTLADKDEYVSGVMKSIAE